MVPFNVSIKFPMFDEGGIDVLTSRLWLKVLIKVSIKVPSYDEISGKGAKSQ